MMARTTSAAAAACAIALLLIAAGCSHGLEAMPVGTSAATAPVSRADADIHRFGIGTLQAVALNDGAITVANNGATVGLGQSRAAIDAVLAGAGLATDKLHLSIQPLLVRGADGKILLFDTGAGSASFAAGGRLPASLRAAGVEPSQVSDIFISHYHPDHIGGLLQSDGALAFANATIHLSEPEWAAMKSKAPPELASLVAKIAPKVAPSDPAPRSSRALRPCPSTAIRPVTART